MKKRSHFFYVLTSFLIFGIFAMFLPDWVMSPLTIVLLAIIFHTVIGTHWKDSFKLSIINYIWILFIGLIFVVGEPFVLAQGGNASGKGLAWLFLLVVIGTPLSLIVLNWTGNKKLPYSLLDKVLSRKNHRNTSSRRTQRGRRKHSRNKSKKRRRGRRKRK